MAAGVHPGAVTPVAQRQQIMALHKAEIPIGLIARYVGRSCSAVWRWVRRVANGGELADLPRAGRPRRYDEDAQLRLISFYCQTRPFAGGGHWTLTFAEAHLRNHPDLLGIAPSRSTIARILNDHRLQPHRSRYFLHISDPDFFPKMECLIALYKSNPKHLYCFDECPGIQVLQRLVPGLHPEMSREEKRTWLEEFEYIRHGTIDVLAFLRVETGTVSVQCRADHTKKTFLSVFQSHALGALKTAGDEPVYYILDNLAAHYSYEFCELIASLSGVACPPRKRLNSGVTRRRWLERPGKRITVAFTPFHGSWLNMVEIWLGIMRGHCLKESYASPDALREAIEGFGRFWNTELAHPFTWRYEGDGLHEKAVQRFIQILRAGSDKTPVRSLLKFLKLMANLVADYSTRVPAETWTKLLETLKGQEPDLRRAIAADDGPQRRQATSKALDTLLDRLAAHLAERAGKVA